MRVCACVCVCVQSDDGQERVCIGSIQELEELTGTKVCVQCHALLCVISRSMISLMVSVPSVCHTCAAVFGDPCMFVST